MDPARLKQLLVDVSDGRIAVDDAVRELRDLPFRDLGFARADTHRHLRTGFPEVVFGQGKTAEQIARLLVELGRGGSTVMATRVSPDVGTRVLEILAGDRGDGGDSASASSTPMLAADSASASSTPMLAADSTSEPRYLPVPRVLVRGPLPPADATRRPIAVLSAGTSDIPVAEEAAITAELAGNRVSRIFDVGVAGIHRLLAQREAIEEADILVVVAGMEGALPSVVAGLFAKAVIAVPTSVGYGANLGGVAALLSMLNSCAGGVAVVNIDNGFGAGQMAALLNRKRTT